MNVSHLLIKFYTFAQLWTLISPLLVLRSSPNFQDLLLGQKLIILNCFEHTCRFQKILQKSTDLNKTGQVWWPFEQANFLLNLVCLPDEVNLYNGWSKSARSRKYSPHWRALQDFEWHNAIFFTTQQLSKLQWISKTFGKEFESIEINNISKFHQNWWTINRDHTRGGHGW